MNNYAQKKSATAIFTFIKEAIAGTHQDLTTGSIRRAVFLLAIPMILEMMMESVFAVVDIFFVGRIGNDAVETVGLTESVLTLVYSIAIGLSMAATATVARRVGEKNNEAASRSGMQAIVLAFLVTVIVSVTGVFFASDILRMMGASETVVHNNSGYTRIMFGGCIFIMLLFLINGIFRGAGDASVAMRSLWIANICNIILCPSLINGWGPFPQLGLEGAAVATTIGRGVGVLYQLFKLFQDKGIIRIKLNFFIPDFSLIKSLMRIAWSGTMQFLIGSASWIVLARIMAGFGSDAMAGYQVAIRLFLFFLLPAWGLSNAAATLVGQNLGAKLPQRAEESVMKVVKYNAIFMIIVTVFFYFFSQPLVMFMNNDPAAQQHAIRALYIISSGYVFYGIGMVLMNTFNGAGDTKTPTYINLVGFWVFQIPLAYFLTYYINMGPTGVFVAILTTEAFMTIVSYLIFRGGKWKYVSV